MFHGLQKVWEAIEGGGKPDSSDKPDSFDGLRDGIRYGYGDARDSIRLEITHTMGPTIISFLEALKAEYAAKGTVLSVAELSCQRCYLESEVLAQIIALCGSKLEFLDLSNNYFEDLQIEPIKEAKSLKRLCLDHNPALSDAAIEDLKRSLQLEEPLVVDKTAYSIESGQPAQAFLESVPSPSVLQSLQSAQCQQDSVPVPLQRHCHQRTFSTATTVVSLNHETDLDMNQGDEPWSQQSNETLVFAYPNSQQASVPDEEEDMHHSSHSFKNK